MKPPPRLKPPIPSSIAQTTADTTSSTDGNSCNVPSSVPDIVEPPVTASVKPSEGLEVRLLAGPQLGHGRHATVHLALYREHSDGPFRSSHQDLTTTSSSKNTTPIWKVCAAKRFAAGQDAQVAGLSEALMLSRLAKCTNVLRYIGLKDERPLTRPSSSRGNSSTDTSDVDGKTSQVVSDAGGDSPSNRPSISRSHSNTSISTPSSPILKPTPPDSSIPTLISLQQRQQEENKASLRRNATVKAPKPTSQFSPRRMPLSLSSANTNEDAPRMLLLTEYCALGNLAMFVLKHGQDVLGQRMFFKFAIDLMTALVAVHEKNIIHGDIKPQNCMVS